MGVRTSQDSCAQSVGTLELAGGGGCSLWSSSSQIRCDHNSPAALRENGKSPMNDGTRVYFLGAGASKQDRFPLTNELKHGIAWAIRQDRSRFELLAAHLQYLYNVQDVMLKESATIWDGLKQRDNDRAQVDRSQMPDVTDLLSTLDWMIRDQSSFGPSLHTSDSMERSSVGELASVRDLVVQALCYCLGTYDDLSSASTTRDFIHLVEPNDSLITTNWDLLLDAASSPYFRLYFPITSVCSRIWLCIAFSRSFFVVLGGRLKVVSSAYNLKKYR